MLRVDDFLHTAKMCSRYAMAEGEFPVQCGDDLGIADPQNNVHRRTKTLLKEVNLKLFNFSQPVSTFSNFLKPGPTF